MAVIGHTRILVEQKTHDTDEGELIWMSDVGDEERVLLAPKTR